MEVINVSVLCESGGLSEYIILDCLEVLRFEEDGIEILMVEPFSMMGLFMVLYVLVITSFCCPHDEPAKAL